MSRPLDSLCRGDKPGPNATLVLMADSRSPLSCNRLSAPYYSLAAAVNLRYAQHQGYDFRYYQFAPLDSTADEGAGALGRSERAGLAQQGESDDHMMRERVRWWLDVLVYEGLRQLSAVTFRRHRLQHWLGRNYGRLRRVLGRTGTTDGWRGAAKTSVYCRHPVYGERSAPWGKLVAIEAGLAAGYERVVYIDSDAVFVDPNRSVEQMLADSSSVSASPDEAELCVFHSVPWTREEANSGFMIWRNTPAARALLARWWHTDAGRFHQQHDYDQSPLRHQLLPDESSRAQISIIAEDCFRERKRQFIRHVASPIAGERIPRFRAAAAKAGLSSSGFNALMRRLAADHLVSIDCESVQFPSPESP